MVDHVTTTHAIAGNVAAYDASILGLIGNSDIVVKFVILLLLAGSVWSWTIIFEKIIKLRLILSKTEKFERLFWSGQVLQQLYERIKGHADHPLACIFVAAMDEWSKNIKIINSKSTELIPGVKERIDITIGNSANRELSKLERNLNFLAVLSAYAPFIGLFGTVWGIMHSFQGIAALKSATLSVVAPGIAEALLATAIGLIAALPAGLFYGFLNRKLNSLDERMENFSVELKLLLSRELDEGIK
jgi:biopolymer transport protein TolQ